MVLRRRRFCAGTPLRPCFQTVVHSFGAAQTVAAAGTLFWCLCCRWLSGLLRQTRRRFHGRNLPPNARGLLARKGLNALDLAEQKCNRLSFLETLRKLNIHPL